MAKKNIALPQVKEPQLFPFTALTRIKHDEVVYEPGDLIELPASAIPQLLAVNALGEADPEAVKRSAEADDDLSGDKVDEPGADDQTVEKDPA